MSGLVVRLEPEQLVELAELVAERIGAPEGPRLLDRRGLGVALGVGVDLVDRLRSEGVPHVIVGTVPRFDFVEVVGWLRSRAAGENKSEGSGGQVTARKSAS